MTERPDEKVIAHKACISMSSAAMGSDYEVVRKAETELRYAIRRAIWQAETAAYERAQNVISYMDHSGDMRLAAMSAIERLIEKEPADGE